ncbi:GntP family permease [Halorhodospira sp. 9621]|uniref:GntP family permease n=1 Tax=Halorhodospira TaxID=85108 RepID=UPI0019126076|nr:MULTISPECIES: GntP family permease [Halorhodospira]MBK5937495.1 transporter [Halorhodospira halophila]MCG5534090.1 GntP family permease [Halorhodospira sp. 9621]MCG5538279.1 GntP family permease [Halorhodospira sp. 9622]
MIEIAAILIALVLLIYLAYRGITLLILAPALAALVTLASVETPLLASYTQVFMGAAADFIMKYFPLFLLGAIFGKLMEDTGSAEVLARAIIRGLGETRAVLAVVLSCAIMTYGGVSLFVVAFAVYPIAASLFRQAQIPKRLIPGTIALGAFTFTMTALPGTPAIQNAIPMPYFGTSPFAAPGLGILTGIVMLVLGQLWLSHRVRQARAAGEGYGQHDDAAPQLDPTLRERAAGEGFDLNEVPPSATPARQPPLALAILPIVLVIGLNLLFTSLVIPAMETGYLAEPRFGATTIDALRGVWSITGALVIAILVLILTNLSRLRALTATLDSGANASLLPIFNTASLVGFGTVIASLAAFETISGWVTAIGGDNPLISLAVAVNVLAGMTGSASGGMSIALATLGDSYLAMGQAAGISPELMHRVTAVATGGLDALPHNGAVITLLSICGLTHRQAYLDIAVVAMLVPLIALVFLITVGSIFGTF